MIHPNYSITLFLFIFSVSSQTLVTAQSDMLIRSSKSSLSYEIMLVPGKYIIFA